MADVDLLPLPNVLVLLPQPIRDAARDYARANMEPLRAEVNQRDSIIATHAADTREYQKRIREAQARAERLAEALRKLSADLRTLAGGETPDGDGVPVNVTLWAEKRLATLAQESPDG